MKKFKIFFYTLFSLDIFVGFIVWKFVNLLAAVITTFVLLFLNLTVYAIILKLHKQLDKAKSGTK
ncbi:MAG: hypothetical protein LBC22_02900 [Endomicrobium sp.]|jgi:uncharacterized membrane protein YqjE|nr:hypothetical protein [Endomicrobium sp.]